ncbi:DUF6777 domain-containing protein [Streptomyces sp. NPDC088730]|uniref:DUF6777 domain-containing protein n=1 Tax=Streptomyces sp. NPDC088730 TaxID=3365877 RepID=UPI00382287BF
MRSPIRLRRAAGATLSAGILLAAGCAQATHGSSSGTKGTADVRAVLLQPAASRGPDPFTASTARPPGAEPTPSRTAPRKSPGSGGGAVHEITGATPGLYGGIRSVASCDVGKQIRLLTADRVRGAAFAHAAGVSTAGIPGFLRGLTPVLLRADTRVADHGFDGGSVTTFQSVLQAGTAVLADGYGLPRVRCACGNPLTAPDRARAPAGRAGEWTGYDPSRIVAVGPAPREVSGLVIVDVVNDAWIERRTGDEGGRDRTPRVPPPYDPDADITGPLPKVPPGEPTDCPTPGVPTPPGEEAAVTASPSGVPEAGRAAPRCPSGLPSGDATEPPELPPDEPTGTPAEPDDPPGDPVPSVTREPQTAIRLPWPDGESGGVGPVTG